MSVALYFSGLSMNILRTGNKSPVQRGFSKNGMGDLSPTLRFLGGLYNFCNFVIGCWMLARQYPVKLLLFSLMYVTMICRRATYLPDLEMIEYYQKTCS